MCEWVGWVMITQSLTFKGVKGVERKIRRPQHDLLSLPTAFVILGFHAPRKEM
jgi:hypothetical protein